MWHSTKTENGGVKERCRKDGFDWVCEYLACHVSKFGLCIEGTLSLAHFQGFTWISCLEPEWSEGKAKERMRRVLSACFSQDPSPLKIWVGKGKAWSLRFLYVLFSECRISLRDFVIMYTYPWWFETICIYCSIHVNHSNFRKNCKHLKNSFEYISQNSIFNISLFFQAISCHIKIIFKNQNRPLSGPTGFSKLLNFTSSRVFFSDATVQDNVFLILHAEFQRFIIAYDILMSTVTFHWSYPTVINSPLLNKDDILWVKHRKVKTVPQSYE